MWRSRKRNTLPRTNQKSFQKLSSSIPNRFKRRLGDHLGPIDFENHQELPKRGPRPPRGVQEKEKPPQKHPKSFQNLPNSTPNRFKRPLGSHVGPMLLKSWISNTRKNDQEAPKRGPRPPRGAQEMPQSVPNPSQMEPKTLPKPIFERFLNVILFMQNFH